MTGLSVLDAYPSHWHTVSSRSVLLLSLTPLFPVGPVVPVLPAVASVAVAAGGGAANVVGSTFALPEFTAGAELSPNPKPTARLTAKNGVQQMTNTAKTVPRTRAAFRSDLTDVDTEARTLIPLPMRRTFRIGAIVAPPGEAAAAARMEFRCLRTRDLKRHAGDDELLILSLISRDDGIDSTPLLLQRRRALPFECRLAEFRARVAIAPSYE
jgi:hypothetical protein